MEALLKFARYIGPLRTMLFLLVLILAVSAFFSMGEMQRSGIMMFPTLIAPAITPLLWFVIPLDMTMCAIMRSGKSSRARQRYLNVIWCDALAIVLLVITWYPFYSRLLSG